MTTYLLKNWQKLTIDFDCCYDEDIRNFDEFYGKIKLDFRKNRSYNLPKELFIDWDKIDDWDYEEIEENLKNYYYCFVDCYIHWTYNFSLENEWFQCRWDTAKKCGIVAIEKSEFEKLWIENYVKFFRDFIKMYNARFNWEIYQYTLEKPHDYFDKDWNKITEYDYVESCGGYYDYQDILEEFRQDILEEI